MRKNGAPVLRRRPGRITVTCQGCGVTFDSIRSQIERRSGGKFHSRACWMDYRARNKQTRLEKLLKQEYGLSLAEYDAMVAVQAGVCGICRRSPEEAGLPRLVVDHDHATGRVRGLLCTPCNLGLERFRDNPSLLASAIRYLDLPSDGCRPGRSGTPA